MERPPNILLFCTDSLRCDALRFMGNENALSPNADRLAAEGVYFTQAHTTSPVCSPARSSLITGLHAPVHGCLENGLQRRKKLDTFPDKLKEAGYHTIMAGKQHFGECPDFDTIIAPTGNELEELSRLGKFEDDRSFADEKQIIPDAVVVNHCIEAMDKANEKDVPFFAFCSINAPHTPMLPPRRCVEEISQRKLPPLNYVEGEENELPEHQRHLLGLDGEKQVVEGKTPADPEHWIEALGRTYDPEFKQVIDDWRRRYYAYSLYADELLGRALDYLDEAGLSENTLVIFTSDHGQQYFDHGFNDKHCWYDESWRVPLVLRQNGTLPAGESRTFASWLDITATILGTAGLESDDVQGYDLHGPLVHKISPLRHCVAGTLFKSFALVTSYWKIEYYVEESSGRLFDRIQDPYERTNLWHSPEHSELLSQLLLALLKWRSDLENVRDYKERVSLPETRNILVSHRVGQRVREWRGRDSEERLNKAVEEIERNFLRHRDDSKPVSVSS